MHQIVNIMPFYLYTQTTIAKNYILTRCFNSKIYISSSKNNHFNVKLHENDVKITNFST